MNKKVIGTLILAAAILLSGCASKAAVADKGSISITDDLGTRIELKSPAKKIISL